MQKQCPKCQSPHPLDALWCPCGHQFKTRFVPNNQTQAFGASPVGVPFSPPLNSNLRACPACSALVSAFAKQCPQCGDPLKAVNKFRNWDDEVSILWTFVFGCFYLMYKGYFKTAFFYAVLALITLGFAWLIAPFFVKHLVKSIEGL